jgi:hypothetical protein
LANGKSPPDTVIGLAQSHGIIHADLIDLCAGVPTVDAVQMCSYSAFGSA